MKKIKSLSIIILFAVLFFAFVQEAYADFPVDLGTYYKAELESIKATLETAEETYHSPSSEDRTEIDKIVQNKVNNIYKQNEITVSWPWFDFKYSKDWDYYEYNTHIEYKTNSGKHNDKVYAQLLNESSGMVLYYLKIADEVLIDNSASIPGSHIIETAEPLINAETGLDFSLFTAEEIKAYKEEIDEEIKLNHTVDSSYENLILTLVKADIGTRYQGIDLSWPWFEYTYGKEWNLYTLKTTFDYRDDKNHTVKVYAEAYPVNERYELIYLQLDEETVIDFRGNIPTTLKGSISALSKETVSSLQPKTVEKPTDNHSIIESNTNPVEQADIIIVQKGDTGSVVKNINECLAYIGILQSTVTEEYNDATVDAVKCYQANNGFAESESVTLEEYESILSAYYRTRDQRPDNPEAPAKQSPIPEATVNIDTVYVPVSEIDCEGKQYKEVVRLFENAGFTNIEAVGYEIEYVPDMSGEDGEVVICSLDSDVSFQKGDACSPDALIKISYRIIVNKPDSAPKKLNEAAVIVRKGDTGGKVREIQTRLQELGYLYGSVDGDFGDLTDTAVKNFQRANNLEETGIITDTEYRLLFPDGNISAATIQRGTPSAQSTTKTVSEKSTAKQEKKSVQITYVVNTKSLIFHYEHCGSKPTKNRGEITGTREELIAMGYRPCQKCNP